MAAYRFGTGQPPHKRWPVAWYNPVVLARSALETFSTRSFIRNFDRRELFGGDFSVVNQSAPGPGGDYWWDFLSDTGDGGNATYTVARALLAPGISPPSAGPSASPAPDLLPRGQLLVLGGDLAYPGAGMEDYQYRFTEMWEAARPDTAPLALTVAAIPQNHDWFDNISSFTRHFAGDHQNRFIGAEAPQNRSYFAASLPHRWWVLGLDFALLGDIDRTQLETFLQLLASPEDPATPGIRRGDDVILLYPEPYWTRPIGDGVAPGYPARYQRLEAALLAAGVRIRIRLAGDLHHYVRERAAAGASLDYDDALITCGSGGAFLHPTHARNVLAPKTLDRTPDSAALTPDLEPRVRVGTGAALSPAQRAYTLEAAYPDPDCSRRLCKWNLAALFRPASATGVFGSAPAGTLLERLFHSVAALFATVCQGNLMFPILIGALHLLAASCNIAFLAHPSLPGIHALGPASASAPFPAFLAAWLEGLLFSPTALLAEGVLVAIAVLIAAEGGVLAIFGGVLNGLLHVLSSAALSWLLLRTGWTMPSMAPLLFLAGAITGGLLFGAYFALLSRLGWLTNNAFAPLAHQGYKGFLRFRIDPDGNLHGFHIGTDRVPERWIRNPAAQRPFWTEQDGEAAPVWKIRDQFTLRKEPRTETPLSAAPSGSPSGRPRSNLRGAGSENGGSV